MKVCVICSGGLDSVSLAYRFAHQKMLSSLVSFNYGQRHAKELNFAQICAQQLNVPHFLIDISSFGSQLTTSALTGDIAVPEGDYREETMRSTIVPNRNTIMLAMAYALAETHKIDAVALAVHGGDHFIYPDCRPKFIQAFSKMQALALESSSIKLLTPYLHYHKSDIVRDGHRCRTPFVQTWSCYKGGEKHCGRCSTCVERREAFYLADIQDPTEYDDIHFWKIAVQNNVSL